MEKNITINMGDSMLHHDTRLFFQFFESSAVQ
jgi:hypothetical protein